MKKIFIYFFLLLAPISFSYEYNIRFGANNNLKNNNLNLDLEAIPYNKGVIEFGLGFSYITPNTIIPLSVLNHINIYRAPYNNQLSSIYFVDKFGLGASNNNFAINYELGLGFDYAIITNEITYTGLYIPSQKKYDNIFKFSIGVRLGDFIGENYKKLVREEIISEKK